MLMLRGYLLSSIIVIATASDIFGQRDIKPSLESIESSLSADDESAMISALLAIRRQQWNSTDARVLAPHLKSMLHRDKALVASAICALASDHPEELGSAVEAVIELATPSAIAGGDLREREFCQIAMAFGRLGEPASKAAVSLKQFQALDEKYPFASVWSAAALARINRRDDSSVEWLFARLSSDRRNVVLEALGAVGPLAKAKSEHIQEMMNYPSGETRMLAARASWLIRQSVSDKILDTLCNAIMEEPIGISFWPTGPSPSGLDHSNYAAITLKQMGKSIEPVIKRLRSISKSGTERQKVLAAKSLEEMQ